MGSNWIWLAVCQTVKKEWKQQIMQNKCVFRSFEFDVKLKICSCVNLVVSCADTQKIMLYDYAYTCELLKIDNILASSQYYGDNPQRFRSTRGKNPSQFTYTVCGLNSGLSVFVFRCVCECVCVGWVHVYNWRLPLM